MDILKIQGTDTVLYELVGPLVMNPAVLRQNNNYPFKTGLRYVWYIATEGEMVVGFLPVKKTASGQYLIDNYYLRGDDPAVLDSLLAQVMTDRLDPSELWVVAHKRHSGHFAEKGFRVRIGWKNYDKMQYCAQ